MKPDFDTIINRRGTNSVKYDFARERGKPEGVLPMWVADMDFAAPAEVLEDLQQAVGHGVFGYSEPQDPYYRAVSAWFGEGFQRINIACPRTVLTESLERLGKEFA